MRTAIWLYLFMFVAFFDLHAQYPILIPFRLIIRSCSFIYRANYGRILAYTFTWQSNRWLWRRQISEVKCSLSLA